MRTRHSGTPFGRDHFLVPCADHAAGGRSAQAGLENVLFHLGERVPHGAVVGGDDAFVAIGSTHPVAMALGGRELQPEESRNLSVGAVFAADNGFRLTLDYFSIEIEDRTALSGLRWSTPRSVSPCDSRAHPPARPLAPSRSRGVGDA